MGNARGVGVMITCPSCLEYISDTAKTCPKCGCTDLSDPRKLRKAAITKLVVGGAVLVVLGIVFTPFFRMIFDPPANRHARDIGNVVVNYVDDFLDERTTARDSLDGIIRIVQNDRFISLEDSDNRREVRIHEYIIQIRNEFRSYDLGVRTNQSIRNAIQRIRNDLLRLVDDDR